jgi:hypothetical protein
MFNRQAKSEYSTIKARITKDWSSTSETQFGISSKRQKESIL